jgi:hypothetical protein
METPSESKPKANNKARKVRPEVEGFIGRVLVPALVKRYMLELKQGMRANTTGSVGGAKTISQNP